MLRSSLCMSSMGDSGDFAVFHEEPGAKNLHRALLGWTVSWMASLLEVG